MLKDLYVICGLPTSGKIRLAKVISDLYNIPLYESVAYSVAGTNSTPWSRPKEYDRLIFQEQERIDNKILSSSSEKVVVVGWHIHNYVYSLMRSNEYKTRAYEKIAELIPQIRIHLLYMSATPDEILQRMCEIPQDHLENVGKWYQEWLVKLSELIDQFGLEEHSFVSIGDELLAERCRFLQSKLSL
jgi:hypothetical protein